MLNAQVLVLNRHYQPVNITNARRAFTMLYMDMARAVDGDFRVFDFQQWALFSPEAQDDALHTVSRAFRTPRVIVLDTYDRMPIGKVRFSRQNVFCRDGYTCQYCYKRFKQVELNLDHVMPRSRGGPTGWDNVVCSCIPCNLKKGRRTPEEAGMRLLRPAVRPKWSALMRHPLGEARYSEWRPYLSVVTAASGES